MLFASHMIKAPQTQQSTSVYNLSSQNTELITKEEKRLETHSELQTSNTQIECTDKISKIEICDTLANILSEINRIDNVLDDIAQYFTQNSEFYNISIIENFFTFRKASLKIDASSIETPSDAENVNTSTNQFRKDIKEVLQKITREKNLSLQERITYIFRHEKSQKKLNQYISLAKKTTETITNKLLFLNNLGCNDTWSKDAFINFVEDVAIVPCKLKRLVSEIGYSILKEKLTKAISNEIRKEKETKKEYNEYINYIRKAKQKRVLDSLVNDDLHYVRNTSVPY